MAFELQKHEPLGDGIRRMATERLALALAELTAGGDPDETVHNVRKRLKELRAILRLVRPALDRQVFDRDNQALRDAGRPLSEARDATVMVETVEMLVKRRPEEISTWSAEQLREALENQRAEIYRRIAGANRFLAKLAGQLQPMEHRVAQWGDVIHGWKALASGLQRVYRKGRKAMAAACHDQHVESWHEWRKRAKDLRYQLELLTPMNPKIIKPLSQQARELGDLLGEEHDLAVLRDLMESRYRDLLAPNQNASVVQSIEHELRERQHQGLKIGDLLYMPKPASFIDLPGNCWIQWSGS